MPQIMIVVVSICAVLALVFLVLLPRTGTPEGHTVPAFPQIGIALGKYEVDTGSYPPTIPGLNALMKAPEGVTNWHGPYFEKEIPPDPWGHNFIYICPGIHNPQDYDLSSRGPDGFVGTDDDIGNWKRK